MHRDDFIIENGILTKYMGSSGDVVIPESVTKIADGAFDSCMHLTSIRFPDTISDFDAGVFLECLQLTSIVAPGIPIYNFPFYDQPAAARGFLQAYTRYTDPQIFHTYTDYIIRYSSHFLTELFAADANILLPFFAEQGLITAERFDASYLTPALKAGAAECIAFLLKWKSIHLPNTNDDFEL